MSKRLGVREALGLALTLAVTGYAYGDWASWATAGSGIKNSVHDFSAGSGAYKGSSATENGNQIDPGGTPDAAGAWNPRNEICVVCHTPHGANTAVSDAPLWNRALTTATFTMYSSGSYQGVVPTGQPDGVSLLCLGCHDGTIALAQYGQDATDFADRISRADGDSTTIATFAPDRMIGTDLSATHPISVDYDATYAAESATGLPRLNPSSGTGISGGGFNGANNSVQNPNNAALVLPLFAGKVQCASCHAVHNKVYTAGQIMGPYLLRFENTASQLCLTCHNK